MIKIEGPVGIHLLKNQSADGERSSVNESPATQPIESDEKYSLTFKSTRTMMDSAAL